MLLPGGENVDRDSQPPEGTWCSKRDGRVGDTGREAKRMNTEREARKAMLAEQIAQGEYRVDPHAIADAILRRVRMVATDKDRSAQNECSYPSSLPSTSPKTTPGGPSMTHPSHVSPVLATTVSASLRALGAMHRHSS